MAPIKLLLGAGDIDFLGLEGIGGEDGDAGGKDFNESLTDVIRGCFRTGWLEARAGVNAHIAGAKQGH